MVSMRFGVGVGTPEELQASDAAIRTARNAKSAVDLNMVLLKFYNRHNSDCRTTKTLNMFQVTPPNSQVNLRVILHRRKG
jgi:hypothetical protein